MVYECVGLNILGIVNPYASAFVFVLGELPGNIISIMLVDAVERKRFLAGDTGMIDLLNTFGTGSL